VIAIPGDRTHRGGASARFLLFALLGLRALPLHVALEAGVDRPVQGTAVAQFLEHRGPGPIDDRRIGGASRRGLGAGHGDEPDQGGQHDGGSCLHAFESPPRSPSPVAGRPSLLFDAIVSMTSR
jgi:hypothetical protein